MFGILYWNKIAIWFWWKSLKFVSIFNRSEVLSGNVSTIAVSNNNFFANLITDVEKLNYEWRMLSDLEQLQKCKNFELDFWDTGFNLNNEMNEPMFPNLSIFVKGIHCLYHSSAAAERVFSQLFLLKTVRNRLNIETCCNILYIKELLNNSTMLLLDTYS